LLLNAILRDLQPRSSDELPRKTELQTIVPEIASE